MTRHSAFQDAVTELYGFMSDARAGGLGRGQL